MTPRKTSSPTEPEPEPEPETVKETVASVPTVNPIGRSQTEPERPVWDIDGKLYDVRVMDDFGIAAQQRLNRDGRDFYQLWNAEEDLTDDQEARMEQLLDRMFFGDEKAPSIIDAPKTLLRKLGAGSRAEVVLTFTLAPLQKLLLAAAQTEIETEKAGVSEPTTTG